MPSQTLCNYHMDRGIKPHLGCHRLFCPRQQNWGTITSKQVNSSEKGVSGGAAVGEWRFCLQWLVVRHFYLQQQ
jgi:hypothetical protein